MTTLHQTLLLAAFLAPAADPDAGKKEVAQLQGGWKLAIFEARGEERDFPEYSFIWFIKGNKIFYGGKELAEFTVDPGTSPKVIDLAFHDPKREHEGIYSLEKDTLRICVNQRTDGGKERPQEFATKDKPDWRLLVFKRDEAAKIDNLESLAGYIGIMIRLDQETKQIIIDEAFEGSPAGKAGLKKGDILLRIGDVDATDLRAVVAMIRRVKPNGELALRYKRDGKEQDVTIKAGVLPFHWFDT